MKNRIVKFAFLLLVMASCLAAEELPMNQLKQIADGLNIEGGTIYHQHFRKNQIWSNLCVVLDRPFEDGVEWLKLTNSNSFPLKEAAIIDYNEPQVNFTYKLRERV